ncbi:AMIN-like domain-containing (lipo)protein [Citricoccus zhacaiensis]
MKRPLVTLGTFVLAVGLATGMSAAAPPPAAASGPYNEPYCGITWGSTAKSVSTMSSAQVTRVRTGRHDCYDRMVVDLNYKVKGYEAHYGSIQEVGTGTHIPMIGKDLSITVYANAYTSAGRPTYNPSNWDSVANVAGYSTFRQVAYGGSFEGHTVFGIGNRARLPYRVLILDGPGTGSRLVVDVAHRW